MNIRFNRLSRLINKLIGHEKINNKNYIIYKESVDIVYWVEETVGHMKYYIEDNGIEFIFDTDVEEKLIECDKRAIERCIRNLVSNAVNLTPEGGLIEVTLYDLDDKVKISVKSNGTGLGRITTKRLITLHGGEIHVNSKADCGGSEFAIILPVCSE